MKRFFGHAVSLLAAGLVVSAVMPACATNDQSIFIRHVLAPPQTRTNGVCSYLPEPDALFLPQGTLDVGITDSYFAFLLVGSQLSPRGDPAQNRTESNRVHFIGGVISVTETDGTVIREFTSFTSGLANPGANNAPDYSLVGLILIDAPTSQALLTQRTPDGAGQLLASPSVTKTVFVKVKVFGETLGGTEIESGEFQYPVQVCNGCLLDFSTGNEDAVPADQQPNCRKALPAMSGASGTPVPCRAGVDEKTPCQLCKTQKICRGVDP